MLIQKVRFPPVIAVKKSNVFSFGSFNAHVSRRRNPSVFFMQHPHVVMLCCNAITYLTAMVFRAVVYDNDLGLGCARLIQNRTNRSFYILFAVVNRNNNGNTRCHTVSLFPYSFFHSRCSAQPKGRHSHISVLA